eukprot:gene30415-35420_t
MNEDPVVSDNTVHGLDAKLSETAALKAERVSKANEAERVSKANEAERVSKANEAERVSKANEVANILNSLWSALEVPEDCPERMATSLVMRNSQRLHTRSLTMCQEEVGRLECAQCQAMKDLVMSRSRELEGLCLATRITPPTNLNQLLAGLAATQSRSSDTGGKFAAGTGQVADVLSKVVRMMDEVNAIAERRAPVLNLVRELDDAREESNWMIAYEADEDRYKGRDANRKLQRAIRAGKQRDKMPVLVAAVRTATHEWRITEGEPFTVMGQDYEEEVLPGVAEEVEALVAERQQHANIRGQSSGGASKKPAMSSSGSTSQRPATIQAKPQTASKAGKPKGGLASLATPDMLSKRHSIAAGGPPSYLADTSAHAGKLRNQSVDFGAPPPHPSPALRRSVASNATSPFVRVALSSPHNRGASSPRARVQPSPKSGSAPSPHVPPPPNSASLSSPRAKLSASSPHSAVVCPSPLSSRNLRTPTASSKLGASTDCDMPDRMPERDNDDTSCTSDQTMAAAANAQTHTAPVSRIPRFV